MTSGTLIYPAGTIVIAGRCLQLCETLAKRQEQVNLLEFGEIGFELKGPKRVFTIRTSELEKER